MTQFKTILMTAAILAAPSIAFAQIDTGAVTDKLKDKAVGEVMDNLTADDAVTAGKTLLKGGSKEDAAIAVVKGRAEDKVESMTGTDVDLDDLSKDGMIEAGKDVAMEKAKGSATKYTNGASVGGVSTGGVLDAGKAMAEEKVKNSATSYGDKAAGSAKKYSEPAAAGSSTTYSEPAAAGSSTTYSEPAAAGSATTYSEPAAAGSSTTYSEPATSTAPLNCPSGTKDAGDGTCMITGNWGN